MSDSWRDQSLRAVGLARLAVYAKPGDPDGMDRWGRPTGMSGAGGHTSAAAGAAGDDAACVSPALRCTGHMQRKGDGRIGSGEEDAAKRRALRGGGYWVRPELCVSSAHGLA